MAAGRGRLVMSLIPEFQSQDQPGVPKKQENKPTASAHAGRQQGVSSKPALQTLPVPSQLQPCLPCLPKPPPPPPSRTHQPSSRIQFPSTITSRTISRPHSYCSQEIYIDKLPPEVLLKIFSYLDADSLFCVGFVNRQFHKLSKDNGIWYELYASGIARKKTILLDSRATQDMPPGFWKRLIFRMMGCPKDTTWKKELRSMDPHTGMPEKTKELLGSLRVIWQITLTDKTGQQVVSKQNHTFFSDSSVTLCWNSDLDMCPIISQVSTIQLHGKIYPLVSTSVDKPQWHSLISKINIHKNMKLVFFGTDKLAKLIYFDEGITVGIWRGTWKIAFIMAHLHFHRLLERSLLGSLSCYYKSMEVIPLYDHMELDDGLQGYTVLVLLHNSVRHILRLHFFPVQCIKDEKRDGFAQFKLGSKPTPVMGKISFPWTAMGLQGDIKDCCVMTLTVLDGFRKPFWCVSTVVHLVLSYSGDEEFVLLYDDVEGNIRMKFEWKQDMKHYLLKFLRVRVSLAKLNKHFKREFFSAQG